VAVSGEVSGLVSLGRAWRELGSVGGVLGGMSIWDTSIAGAVWAGTIWASAVSGGGTIGLEID